MPFLVQKRKGKKEKEIESEKNNDGALDEEKKERKRKRPHYGEAVTKNIKLPSFQVFIFYLDKGCYLFTQMNKERRKSDRERQREREKKDTN